MSKIFKKIEAFTVNEMLVVLLVTTIVVGMAFSVLNLVQSHMGGIESNYERNTELNLLRQSLWIDFNQCDGVWFDTKNQEMVFENGIKTTTYRIYDTYITKERDTFFVAVADKKMFFLGKARQSGEIDALDLKTSDQNGAQRLFVFKKNAATSHINE